MSVTSIGEVVSNMFESILEPDRNDGDYDVDGVLYCGKCRTPKQTLLDLSQLRGDTEKGKTLVRCMCKCETEARDARIQEQKYREEMRKVEQIRAMSLIESRLRNATLDTFVQTKDNADLFKIATKYVENFEEMFQKSQGLLFWGSVGTGKSYTAACIANELMNRCNTVIMTSFVKILQKIQSPQMDETQYITWLNSVKLLVIDDLGTERDTGYAIEKIYNIIDSRYLSKKPLILTTNLTLQDMQTCEDVRYRRVYDRIFEMCYPVKVSGTSWRLGQAAQRFDDMKKFLEG